MFFEILEAQNMIVNQSDNDQGPQIKTNAIILMDQHTEDSRAVNAASPFVQWLLADTLTERSYFQSLEIWVQCWRTFELLEQLHRPKDAPHAAIPVDRCRFAQADLRALNKHFRFIQISAGVHNNLGPAFPFWSKTAVSWYGLVYAMGRVSQTFEVSEQHLLSHFSRSFSGDHLSFFSQLQSSETEPSNDRTTWNESFNSALADEENLNGAITTANDIFHWLTRCLIPPNRGPINI